MSDVRMGRVAVIVTVLSPSGVSPKITLTVVPGSPGMTPLARDMARAWFRAVVSPALKARAPASTPASTARDNSDLEMNARPESRARPATPSRMTIPPAMITMTAPVSLRSCMIRLRSSRRSVEARDTWARMTTPFGPVSYRAA